MNSTLAPPRRSRFWLLLLLIPVIVLLAAILALRSVPLATKNAVRIDFLGYTNVPEINRRYALFSVSNQAPYAVHWRGQGAEINGDTNLHAVSLNPKLPGYTYYHGAVIKTNLHTLTFSPVFNPGESLRIVLAEPLIIKDEDSSGPPTNRWRLSMFFCRYTLSERYFDLAARKHLPLKLGPIVLVDTQRFLNPSNNVTASSPWISE